MMKRYVLALGSILSLHLSPSYAQGYDRTLKKCIENFHDGIGKLKKETATEEMDRRYLVLSECIKGQKFPDFNLTQYDGSKYSSKQHQNKVVLINFWFTKNKTSVATLPMLNELSDEFKGQDFIILSFASDGFAALSAFMKEKPLKFKVFEKSNELINHQFKTLLGYPTNIILNKKGEVVEYKVGAGIKPEEIQKAKAHFKKVIEEELAK
jgi:thiol-disulfide isomerase/thioredoxin